MNHWHLLPEGMRARKQWVVANDKKEPLNPFTGQKAEVDNPDTWSTFEDATKAALWSGMDIGYVLSEDCPYTIIDLDNKEANPAPPEMLRIHADVVERADTYIERSISGTGTHIVVLGKPPRPIKTAHIEVYGERRMMVCTGDVVKDFNIANGDDLLALLDKHFGNASMHVDPAPELPDYLEGTAVEDDEAIIKKAWYAENGDKFQMLWAGDASWYGDDHSKADSALLNMLCFFTPHNEQVRRVFKRSKLYRKTQANRQTKYMNYSIAKWRAENAPVDLNALRFPAHLGVEPEIVEPEPQAYTPIVAGNHFPLPPGLIGDIAKFCYNASYRPVAEASVATAICYVAALIGRAYHIQGRGPNQYAVFLAESGVGKEGAKDAIMMLHRAVMARVPAAHMVISTGDFSSGIAMIKSLVDAPCTLALSGEIGQRLKLMLDPRAPAHMAELKLALTDAWSQSGPAGILRSRKYSDKAKNASDIQSPCLSYLGESTPAEFYNAISANAAIDGFVPRFLVFHYLGDRPPPNRKKLGEAPADLVQRICDLYVAAKSVLDHGQMMNVQFLPEVWTTVCAHEEMIDERVRNEPPGSPMRAILNRTHEKARRLMCLFAACSNPYHPMITAEIASAAIDLVERCDGPIVEKFKDGEVAPATSGEGEGDFADLMRRAAKAYAGLTVAQRVALRTPKGIAEKECLPTSFLRNWLKMRAAVKNHKMGISWAIKACVQAGIDEGIIYPIPKGDAAQLGATQVLYRVLPN